MVLTVSMMCADYGILGAEVESLDRAGADMFHIDVMDGRYVPNFALGPQDIGCIRKHTRKPVDVHLMIEEPGRWIKYFAGLGADIIYIHPDSEHHPARTLGDIRALGLSPGVAVNPGVAAGSVRELLPLCDWVLLMTVNPGFAGQAFIPHMAKKAEGFASLSSSHSFRLAADGALSPPVITDLHARGVESFVLGTSSIFGGEKNYSEGIKTLREIYK